MERLGHRIKQSRNGRNFFAAVYQTHGEARELIKFIPLQSSTVAAGEALHFSGTFTVPAELTNADEIKLFV